MSNALPIALTRLLEHISTINSVSEKIDPYDHYAACWVTLIIYKHFRKSVKHVCDDVCTIICMLSFNLALKRTAPLISRTLFGDRNYNNHLHLKLVLNLALTLSVHN